MDRKTFIILGLCVVLWLLLNQAINKFFPPIPLPPGSTNAPAATVTGTNVPVAAAAGAPAGAAAAAVAAPQFMVDTNAEEVLLLVTNDNARYTFTSHGGGLKLVELVRYPEAVNGGKKAATNRLATLNAQAKVPTLAILDGEAVQGNGIFILTRTATGVQASKQLTNGLSIVKEFTLDANYLVNATVRLENQSTQALALPRQEWAVGTATPMNAQDKGQSTTVGMMWYNGQKTADMLGASYFSDRGFGCVPRTPPGEYRAGQSNVVWAAAHNQFFALALMPQQPALEVIVRRLELPRPTGEEAKDIDTNAPPPHGYETTLVYPALALQPGQTHQQQFVLFAGPKEYRTLARIATRFNNNLDSVMGFGFFGFFAKALLLGMNWLSGALHLPYGWTIVAITILIKVVFWPLTAASTRSMKKMQALSPQIKAIQEKYKEDPMKVQRKTMELWKENKVNPMGGCLPMLIQMPVFIGFYTMIRTAIELRGASFLWIHDLSRPDTLFMIPGLGFIPFGIGVPGVGLPFNLLPLIMGATMLWQSHLAPTSPGVDPTQQKIMRFMPLIFLVFLYNYSAGMALYWTTNNLLTIVQTKLTKMQTAGATPAPKAPALTPAPKKKK